MQLQFIIKLTGNPAEYPCKLNPSPNSHPICQQAKQMTPNSKPALVAEWTMPLAAVQAGQGSFPVRVEA